MLSQRDRQAQHVFTVSMDSRVRGNDVQELTMERIQRSDGPKKQAPGGACFILRHEWISA
jgi:hypothetical protein